MLTMGNADTSDVLSALVESITQGLSDNPLTRQLQELTCKTYKSAHDDPPIEQLEVVLRVRFTAKRARQLLFRPQLEEFAAFYPDLIRDPPDGESIPSRF